MKYYKKKKTLEIKNMSARIFVNSNITYFPRKINSKEKEVEK